jgi:hypothetical protein
MSSATYDNPATMTRENYVDGTLTCAIQARLLLDRTFQGGDWFPMVLNTGKWQPGKIIGNRDALPQSDNAPRS